MRRKIYPYNGRRYLIDINPLSKVVHDLENEKKSCNIHKVIKPHVKMLDNQSQVNRFLLLNGDYSFCKCCLPEKYQYYNK
ncbi:hypothetical protein [Paramaledivibacter caminithermalis]|jgi:hypothetical protein|uniref:Uncharacterized protein n=1 Tax=Paramaledivibacter caminithermalis (strain DSM 15212 / CIP 107654 / DViRD3) TaxID=1121301 RepID=A0A1M6RNW6_PARC5|nr:hypothetical protein [Paramaledivibacter caminithermalis]SHK34145.1 hypothetical protein SAMN02745912_03027 [Paramaledivibacter caminithermalis DSM 15212]